jgi:hypothetical protein
MGDLNRELPGAPFAAIAGSTEVQRVRRLTLHACIAGHTADLNRVILKHLRRIFWDCIEDVPSSTASGAHMATRRYCSCQIHFPHSFEASEHRRHVTQLS